MRKERLILLEKQTTKNDVGAVVTYFTEGETVWSDYVLPLSEKNQQLYGYDPVATLETRTRETRIKENNFVRYKNKIYHIPQVLEYPRHFIVILQEVNTANDSN